MSLYKKSTLIIYQNQKKDYDYEDQFGTWEGPTDLPKIKRKPLFMP